MTPWPFAPLLPLTYSMIVADPPWTFKLRSDKGKRKSAQAQYDCMSLQEIAALPVHRLARGDCLLFLWGTWPMLPAQLEVMSRWGFRYITGGAWRKLTTTGKVSMGTGYRLRNSCDPFLIGTIGNPPTKAQRNIFDGLRRQHSRKPDEAYAFCERLVPSAARRAELFARERRPGWEAWGNETEKFTDGLLAAAGRQASVPAAHIAAGGAGGVATAPAQDRLSGAQVS